MAGFKRLSQLRVDLSAISSYCGFFGWYILSFINGVRVCVFDLFLIDMRKKRMHIEYPIHIECSEYDRVSCHASMQQELFVGREIS